MFEFIPISNGVEVVQHTPSGQVYRFRPNRPGLWQRLTLNTIDARNDADHAADHYAAAACSFAEHATAFCSTTAILARSAVTVEARSTGMLRRMVAASRGKAQPMRASAGRLTPLSSGEDPVLSGECLTALRATCAPVGTLRMRRWP